MKIGVFAGSFNPIHNAHLRVAELAIEQANLEKLYIEVCNDHYGKKGLVPAKDRYKMAMHATLGIPNINIGNYEISIHDRQPKTIETLDYYRSIAKEVVLVCGGDLMELLDTFKDFTRIVEEYGVVCVSRCESLDKVSPIIRKNLTVAKGITGSDISSTAIRDLVKSDRSIRNLVPEVVRKYIADNRLYR